MTMRKCIYYICIKQWYIYILNIRIDELKIYIKIVH